MQETTEAHPSHSWGIVQILVPLVVGLVVGAAASWPLFFGALDRAAPAVDGVLHVLLPILGALGAILALGVPLAWWGIRHFIGRTRGTLDEIVREAAAATRAVSESNHTAAASHAERAILEALAWYGPAAARRFVVQTALALLVAFGGLIGTALLFRQTLLLGAQNELLIDQNRKVDRQVELLTDQNRQITLQTITAEAQRRGALSQELFSIMQAVTAGDDMPAAAEGQQSPRTLSRNLTARIVAFSRAASPYWVVEVPERDDKGDVQPPRLADRASSPERGQLLVGLVSAGVAAIAQANFSNADLRKANLRKADLRGVDLYQANLIGATLEGATLVGADLRRADLRQAFLYEADMDGARLSGANLASATLARANLRMATLRTSNLGGAMLAEAEMRRADLREANLREADLRMADLRWTDLSNATLIGADLRRADLRELELNGADLHGALLNEADLRGTNLRRTDLAQVDMRGAIIAQGQDLPDGWEAFDDGQVLRLRRAQ